MKTLSSIISGKDPHFSSFRDMNRREHLASLKAADRKQRWVQHQALLQFVQLVIHRCVKSIRLEGLYLDPELVKALCSHLPELPRLTVLSLTGLSCKKHRLLESGGLPGGRLQFMLDLTTIQLSDVDEETIHSLSVFCPNLLSITIKDSNLSDQIVTFIACMKKLKSLSFEGEPYPSPCGYAELLRNLSDLRNLGQCNCFGEVLSTLYSNWSIYNRSVGGIPGILKLESVDCNGPISGQEIAFIQTYCPNIKSIKLAYSLMNRSEARESFGHLTSLSTLSNLQRLGVTSADFYSHSLFSVLRMGSKLTSLELANVDEMNLNAIMMIGSSCPNLEKLSIFCCHYTVEEQDTRKLAEACTEKELMKENAPFKCLKEAKYILNTSTHLPLLKYPVYFARGIQELRLDQVYQPVDDGFISALISWNPMAKLERFQLNQGPHLSIMAANTLIQACPRLNYIGNVLSWGMVEGEEVIAMRGEIKNRNLDLVLV